MKLKALILSLFISQSILACSCDCTENYTNLCELLNDNELNTLVEAVYLEKTADGLDKLKLIKNWYGTKLLDTIFYVTRFISCHEEVYGSPGEVFLLNVESVNGTTSNQEHFVEDTLTLWTCRAIFLKRVGPMLYGSISFSDNQMLILDLEQYLENGYQEELNCYTCRCYCSWSGNPWDAQQAGSFCGTLKLSNTYFQESTLVARVFIEETSGFLTTARIEGLLQGSETKETISIWHSRGQDCRATSSFELNKSYIVNLKRIAVDERRAEEELVGDYKLRKCGVTQLYIENEMVTGDISNSAYGIPYPTFQELVISGQMTTSENCLWAVGLNPLEISTQIGPNPFNNFFKINSNELINNIQIVDINGQELMNMTPTKRDISLDMSAIEKGIYLLIIETAKGKVVEKICKL